MGPGSDVLVAAIAAHARQESIRSHTDLDTARGWFLEALAQMLRALRSPGCTRLVRPVVPGAVMPGGARVPGTSFELDPVQAAFCIGVMVGWREAGDTPVAVAHPAQNLGGILSTADYLARRSIMQGKAPPCLGDVLAWLLTAYEIQGLLTRTLDLERFAGDHTLLIRLASAATVTAMLGGGTEQIGAAVASAWLDGPTLCVQLDEHHTGPRVWAAADATSRGVRHALVTLCAQIPDGDGMDASECGLWDAVPEGKRSLGLRSFTAARVQKARQAFGESVSEQVDAAIDEWFLPRQAQAVKAVLVAEPARLDALPVNELMARLVTLAPRPKDNRQMELALHLPAP